MEKTKIGKKAGVIWGILREVTEISMFELCRKAGLNFEDAAMAIGWLAREGKVSVRKKNDMLFVGLQEKLDFSFG